MSEGRCGCSGAPLWPPLRRLAAPGPDRYYLCTRCGRVRKELCRADGTVQRVLYYDEIDALPPKVAGEVRRVLGEGPEQLALFGDWLD